MATPGAETILITVDIVSNTARLVELQKQLNDNRAAVQALTKANAEGKLSNDELAAGQQRLKQQATATAGEIKTLTKANEQQAAANKAAAGSVDELKAKSALLTTQYNALSEAERTGTAAGKALGAELRQTNQALQQSGKAVSDGRRSVGLYEEALNGAVDKLGKMRERATALPGPLGGIAQGMLGTASGIVSATRAAVAFIATPLGLVLAAVAAAVYAVKAAFTSSEEGQDKYAKLMAIIGTTLGNLVDLAAAVGEKLIAAFENPQKAAEALGGFIKENFINRFVGLLELLPRVGTAIGLLFRGEFAAAGKVAADAVGKVTLGVNSITDAYNRASQAVRDFAKENLDEANAAVQVQQRLQDATILERALLTERARTETRIAELQLKAREREKFSAAERKAALLEAQSLQDGLFTKEKKVLELRRDAQIIENTFSRTNTENLDKEEAAKAAVIRIDAQRADAQRANIRLLNSLNAETAAGAEAARKAKDEAMLKSIEADIAAGLSREAAAAKYLADEDKARAQAAARDEKARTDKLAADRAAYAEQESMLERFLARMGAKTATDYAAGLLDKRGYDAAVEQQEGISYASRIMLATKFGKDTTALVEANARREIAAREKAKDQQQRIKDVEIGITQAGASAAAAATDAFILGAGKETDAGLAGLVIKKGIALAEIGISLEKRIAANALAGAKISAEAPPVTVPLGIAYTTTQNVLAIAEAAVSAATVLAFNTGGVVPGQGNTDTVPAMLTPGEVVMNKQASQTYLPLLSHLNSISGGVAFATGGLVPGAPARATPINDGGFLARQLGSTPPQLDYPTLIKAIADYGQFDVGVRNIERATTRRAMPRAASTLGG